VRIDQIGLLIGGIAFGLFLTMVIITIIVPTEGRRFSRYNQQRAALREFFAAAPGASLEFDWAVYGEVPKPEILVLAGKSSWKFVSDELTDTGWTLRFTKQPGFTK
jgi:hypothetical protein